MNQKINISLLIGSLVSFFIVALDFTLMYFAGVSIQRDFFVKNIVMGVCFWIFLLTGIIFQIMLSVQIKKWCIKTRLLRSKYKKNSIGIISFFSNTFAIVSDILLGVCLVLFTILFLVTDGTNVITYILFSILFLSFCGHCIFNGKNYYYITNYPLIQKHLTKWEEK